MNIRLLIILLFLWSSGLVSGQSYVPEKHNRLVQVAPVVPVQAYGFNLYQVKLLRSPFQRAMSLDSAYLMQLRPDRLLYRFYQNAHLPVKDSVYGGWESEGLSGHTLGHYLSALSMMYASTGQEQFKKRAVYITNELARCQRARGTGYVGAIPGEDTLFARVARGDIKSGGFDLNGGWSPWYTVHKVMAGLCDVYLYCKDPKALEVVKGMADWTQNIVGHLSDSLRLKMLNCEYGGMNDVLAAIYSFTGNKKYLDLSYKFYDEFVMGKLAQQIDPLPGKHSNTNVPKAIGSARQFSLTGNERDRTIARFFWQTMVQHHSYVIGGNSNYEYCGKQDSLSDRLSDNTCETCNTYNMLKLTRHLFSWAPDGALMDYYERALYNHILASQNPTDGMMCYFVPLRMGTQKQFSDSFNTFTCCVGSGIENHSKYAESIYAEGSDGSLFVNLFIASKLDWRARNLQIRLETTFPEEEKFRLIIRTPAATKLTLRIRKPFWATKGMMFTCNGKMLEYKIENGFAVIYGRFKNNDILECTVPMELYTEAMPDNKERIAFKYGPLVLAGLLGKDRPDPVIGVPVLLTSDKNVGNWVQRTDMPLRFKLKNVGKPFDPELVPFYTVYDQYYSVYWDYFTPAAWETLRLDYENEKRRIRSIELRTIDDFRMGEMQPERDHKLVASERSYVDEALGRKGREARRDNYFSFVMKVEPGASLLFTYLGDDKDRSFDLLVDGKIIQTVHWSGGKTGKFYDMEYSLPSALIEGKSEITIRVEANHGKTAGRIFNVKTLRSSKGE